MEDRRVYYFGVIGEPGHYLFRPGGCPGARPCHCRPPDGFPCSDRMLDAGFLSPYGPQEEGKAVLVHLSGWTILTFWDRSGDQRMNSNSSFVAAGTLTFGEIVERSKAAFREVWRRFTFPVTGPACKVTLADLHTPQPCDDWHEDDGVVLWFHMPICEPPFCGSPLDSDWPWEEEDEPNLWWTPLPDCNELMKAWEAKQAAKLL